MELKSRDTWTNGESDGFGGLSMMSPPQAPFYHRSSTPSGTGKSRPSSPGLPSRPSSSASIRNIRATIVVSAATVVSMRFWLVRNRMETRLTDAEVVVLIAMELAPPLESPISK